MTATTIDRVVHAQDESTIQHSIGKSLALHILPGILMGALFILTAPLVMRLGFPSLFAMLTAGMSVGMGFQLWHLLHEGRKRNGKWSLDGIVFYKGTMPIWQYFVWVPLFTIAAFLVDGLTSPIGAAILKSMPWVPEWFEMRDISMFASFSRPALVATFTLVLLFNGIVGPIIEELYFRGYLMPRLARFGRWTPLIELTLFTVYHIWQPYYWITQFFGMLPVVTSVWWKRNVKLGILVHMTMNIIGGLLIAARVLG